LAKLEKYFFQKKENYFFLFKTIFGFGGVKIVAQLIFGSTN